MTQTGHYIGLMSGTSVDAVDVALAKIDDHSFTLVEHISHTIAKPIRDRILRLFEPGNNEIDTLGSLDIELARMYADAVNAMLITASMPSQSIAAIGSHGQTLRHRPNGVATATSIGLARFTLQIGDANTLAALTNIPTIADFRRKDMALGGQGAPLAPLFHAFLCKHNTDTAILNLGGIANISLLSTPLLGFDIGPANALLDAWFSAQYPDNEHHFDQNGDWARGGKISPALLQALERHPFYSKSPPKSTGKEEFTLTWLRKTLSDPKLASICARDIQATLTELTARSISATINNARFVKQVLCCGGGTKNQFLMERIRKQLKNIRVGTSEELGIPADAMEACAFAWFAYKTMNRQALALPSVTGAARPAILGGIYYP